MEGSDLIDVPYSQIQLQRYIRYARAMAPIIGEAAQQEVCPALHYTSLFGPL
jgi:hypothetical protein